MSTNSLAMQETQEIQVQSLGQEDPLEGGHGNPLQYFCLEKSMGRGAWQTQLSPWGHEELDTTE